MTLLPPYSFIFYRRATTPIIITVVVVIIIAILNQLKESVNEKGAKKKGKMNGISRYDHFYPYVFICFSLKHQYHIEKPSMWHNFIKCVKMSHMILFTLRAFLFYTLNQYSSYLVFELQTRDLRFIKVILTYCDIYTRI